MKVPPQLATYADHFTIIKIIESSSAVTALTKSGILINVDLPIEKDEKSMQEMLDAYEELCQDSKRVFLIDPQAMKGLKKNTRKMAVPYINKYCSHFAVVNSTPLSNVILSFLTKIDGIKAKPKVCKSIPEAAKWTKAIATN